MGPTRSSSTTPIPSWVIMASVGCTSKMASQATNYNGDLGVASSGDGSAYVDGPGSVWTNNSVLAVGVSGTAMLSVSNGGSVTSTNGRIGREAGSNGAAFIDGAGSNWTASGDMSIGYFGTGALNILNGAKLSRTQIQTSATEAAQTAR